MKAIRFKVGDMVRPRPEWREPYLWKGRPCGIPAGRIVRIEPWGDCGAIYVDGVHYACAGDVFERDVVG